MEFEPPCRTTKYPRQVPELPWYRTSIPQMLMAGFLPFSAIYIELFYIFSSVWGFKVCAGADCVLRDTPCIHACMRTGTHGTAACCLAGLGISRTAYRGALEGPCKGFG